MSKFKAVPGLCYELSADLAIDDTVLNIANGGKLVDCLEDSHTYLIISDGIKCEYVKVTAANGQLILSDRALEFTESCNFFKGDKVSFDWTSQALSDWLECQATEEVDEDKPPVKIPGLTAEYDEELGQWCYESQATDIEWRDAKHSYTWKNGTITKEPLSADQTLMDGCYENAKVTVSGCRIVKIEQGDKPLYTPSVSNKCCTCGGTTDDV